MMEGGASGSVPDDALLSRLYQQVTYTQELQFAAGYDLEAGLSRYQAWLRGHSEFAGTLTAAADASDALAPDASDALIAGTMLTPTAADAPDALVAATTLTPPDGDASDALVAGTTLTPTAADAPDALVAATTLTPPDGDAPDALIAATTLTPTAAEAPDTIVTTPAPRGEWSADLAVIELYSMHYTALVRLSAMLVRDTPTAEEVVQDSFVAMHDGWERLRDTEKALAYMRQAVVNRSRSVLRHRMVVEKNQQKPPPDMPSAEHGAMAMVERSAVIAALRDLPERQREAIVLRYYADLSEAEIAAAMKISRGAVKSHTSRGMAALRMALEYDV
jgi:RNA polymerase sigma-70 factor (sigma-E family)